MLSESHTVMLTAPFHVGKKICPLKHTDVSII